MKIVMEVGKGKYIGFSADRMYEVVPRKKALEFAHAGDIFDYINGNRKKINSFLRQNSLDMILRVEDQAIKIKTDGNECPTEEFALAS